MDNYSLDDLLKLTGTIRKEFDLDREHLNAIPNELKNLFIVQRLSKYDQLKNVIYRLIEDQKNCFTDQESFPAGGTPTT